MIDLVDESDIKCKKYIYTDEELLGYLRQFHKETGRSPMENDFDNNPKFPHFNTYTKRFGSWNKTLKLTGLKTNCGGFEYADEELLGYLRQFHKETGRSPMVKDFNNSSRYPSYSTYICRFGSWSKAIEIAGLLNNRNTVRITDNELLGYLKQFHKDNGRPPMWNDFIDNSKYPSITTYRKRFGSWQKALKLVGLDVDAMVKKGILPSEYHKGRLFEMIVLESPIMKGAIDLSGDNCNSPVDGICPKGEIYNAKSSGLVDGRYWVYNMDSIYRYKTEWFYLGGFDKDYKNLLHVWRIHVDFIDGNSLIIGLDNNYRFNIENMKEYEITDKFMKQV